MEKNRYMNQNLSKGQLSETKKNQDVSVKWPRQSKRRGEQSEAGNHRQGTGTGKQVPNANKNRYQSNYNYDARHRTQRPARTPADDDAGAWGGEGFGSSEPPHLDGGTTGLGEPRPNPPTNGARGELHSVFSPGSKKQSLNHLLNFHYAPRDRDQPARFTRTGNNNVRKHAQSHHASYNKEQFLQANCQFVVRAGEDYGALLAAPDQLVQWDKIEQIHVLSSEDPRCPICLYPPVAAKMTKCGHVYCWPCLLHYLALSDKAWRKCPICYDAIHLPDLRPAVSKPFHAFGMGEFVTLQLMRREKGTMIAVQVDEEGGDGGSRDGSTANIPHFDALGGNSILTKLLLTDTVQMLSIIDRERAELENQLVADGADAPENIFVQQALDLLLERRAHVVSANSIGIPASLEAPREAHEDGLRSVKEEEGCEAANHGEDGHCGGGTDSESASTASDFVIDEESNFTVGDIDIVPTAQCAGDHYYFYQSVDGQPLFLHSINSRMLQATYGSLDRSPRRVTGRVVQKDSCSMDENLRRRLKYLQHLPVCTQFEVVELDFGAESGLVSGTVFAQFQDELAIRRRTRQKRDRAEQKREKQIFEFNERQLGKAMARSARISIESTKQFPTCGTSDSYEEPSPFGTSPVPSDVSSSSPGCSGSGLSSWSKMVGSQPTASQRWPSLGSGAAASTSNGAGAAPKVVQVTGSRMTVTAGASRPGGGWHSLTAMSDEDENDEDVRAARAPRFNNDLGSAIEAALEKKVSTPSGRSAQGAGADGGPSGGAGRRKKNKKTLLFASGMNLN